MKSEKRGSVENIDLPNKEYVRTLDEDNQQTLGNIKKKTLKQAEIKGKRKEFQRRTRNLLKIKFCSKNIIEGINKWVVILVRYSGQFLNWTRKKLKQMDQKTI